MCVFYKLSFSLFMRVSSGRFDGIVVLSKADLTGRQQFQTKSSADREHVLTYTPLNQLAHIETHRAELNTEEIHFHGCSSEAKIVSVEKSVKRHLGMHSCVIPYSFIFLFVKAILKFTKS